MPRWNSINDFHNYIIKTPTCWIWGGTLNIDGYGTFKINKTFNMAHRLAWELVNDEIPEGLVIDHLCRMTSCVNPSHMEVVTNVENVRRGEAPSARNKRKTHCLRGHILDGSKKDGARFCYTCERQRCRDKYKRLKLKALEAVEHE